MKSNNFSDHAAVEVIRSALWRESGSRAAIMVGAGFSRNAEPKSASTREMPSWAQMAASLCAKLYPIDSSIKSSALRDAMSTSGFLRLAQEYKVAFGQGSLNEQIRALVPDNEYEPGKLHKLLLNLPWTDIHTTNWDTLLERGARETFDINYDVVRTFSEIPVSRRPRIVKLHGSFPAHEPFIFTEEDYRTYPRTHAPFVNLVQQSLMESVLCLIGFSGDDPNFLHWTGWVRDNLGVHAPKIYLVGCLALSNHRRRLLEDRNVVPVDLSCLPGFENWPDEKKHYYATEWFLRSLSIKEQYEQKDWPERPITQRIWPPHLPLPTIPVETLPEAEPVSPEMMQVSDVGDDNVTRITDIWQKNRDIYPGWMIAPLPVRDRLWKSTFSWIRPICTAFDRRNPIDFLLVLDELIWRLETCLSPHFSEVVEAAKKTLEKIDIANRIVQLPDGIAENTAIDWRKTIRAWCRVSVWLAIDARCEGEFETASILLTAAKQFASDYDDIHNSIEFEECLILRDQAMHKELSDALSRWEIAGGDSAWLIRKCGLLAGIGLHERAKSCMEYALHQTRKYRRRDYVDHAAYSREAWLLWLAAASKLSQTLAIGDSDYNDSVQRLRRLGDYDCNVLDDFERLVEKLKQAIQNPQREVSEQIDFFGRRSQSLHFTNGVDERLKRSYEVIRLADATGFPPSVSMVKVLSDGLLDASRVLISSDAWLGLLWSIRASAMASDQGMDMLSQARIALLEPKQIELGRSYVLAEITTALGATRQQYDQHSKHCLPTAIEIYARLLSRSSTTNYEFEMSLLLDLLKNERCIADSSTHRPISTLLKNLFKVVDSKTLAAKMPSLFALPIRPFELLPEPADHLSWEDKVSHFRPTSNHAEWAETFLLLLQQCESADKRVRAIALRRMMIIHQMGYLNKARQKKVAQIVWRADFCDDSGWPIGDLYPWAYFSLPEPTSGYRTKIFRKKFLGESTGLNDFSLNVIGTSIWVAKKNNLEINLNKEEIIKIKDALHVWSKRKITTLDNKLAMFLPRDKGPDLIALNGISFLTNEIEIDCELASLIWYKLEKLENQDPFSVMQLYPRLLSSLPDRKQDVEEKIRISIHSTDHQLCTAACQALLTWCELTQSHVDFPSPSLNLIDDLGWAIESIRRPILIPALQFTTQINLNGPIWVRDALANRTYNGLVGLRQLASYAQESDDTSEVPLIRQNIARVVATIKATYYDAPSIFDDWYKELKQDPLQEVRLALHFDIPDDH